MYAQQHKIKGLSDLDECTFYGYIAVQLFLGFSGLSNARHIWEIKVPLMDTSGIRAALSYASYAGLNRVISECGFDAYPVGHELADGRRVPQHDKLSKVRKFVDTLQNHWRDVFNPGTTLLVDETMIPWQGESFAFTVYLPNKPHPNGFCLKVLCDARSRVLLSLEWVEDEAEQSA